MGADNWAHCPRCAAIKAARVAEQEAAIADAYGKVPASEFLAMQDALAIRKVHHLLESLREDYELGIHNGKFSVSYSAGCSVCGFKFKFKHEDDKLQP